MAIQPGDRGNDWFAVELVSVEVPVEPPAPAPEIAGGGGFTAPVVPRPVEFRFRGRLRGPRIEPFRAELSATLHAVKTFERVVPGKAHAVREVTFAVSGFRDPAYRWAEVLRDDDELLAILYSR